MTFHKKPIRKAKENCSPVSSNCVVWQGPDIPFLDLCHGDSVTEVVFELATKVQEIITSLDPESYDLKCFDSKCPPANFADLLQAIIDRSCDCDCEGGGSTGAVYYFSQYEQYQMIIDELYGYNPQGVPFLLLADQTTHVTPLDILIDNAGEYVINVDFSVLGGGSQGCDLGYELRIDGTLVPYSTRANRQMSSTPEALNVNRHILTKANITEGQTIELWIYNNSTTGLPGEQQGLQLVNAAIQATKIE